MCRKGGQRRNMVVVLYATPTRGFSARGDGESREPPAIPRGQKGERPPMPKWRNRQTRAAQTRVPQGVRVRLPPSALFQATLPTATSATLLQIRPEFPCEPEKRFRPPLRTVPFPAFLVRWLAPPPYSLCGLPRHPLDSGRPTPAYPERQGLSTASRAVP